MADAKENIIFDTLGSELRIPEDSFERTGQPTGIRVDQSVSSSFYCPLNELTPTFPKKRKPPRGGSLKSARMLPALEKERLQKLLEHTKTQGR